MRKAAIFLCLFLLAPAAQAWSEFGHQLVAEIAWRRLSPAARAQVDLLLQGEADPTLRGIAAWPDEIRDRPEYEHTSAWHYVRIRDAHCGYVAARDCADGQCVVGAIERARATLADRTQSRAERAEALKFLVHFVGDVHQPMHAGHRDDRGGNLFQVNLRGEGTNLHAVWDYHVLRSADLDFTQWVQMLETQPAMPHGEAPSAWAEASCRLTNAEGFYPARPGKLAPAYLQAHRDIAVRRLREAGAELAAQLEAALAP